MHLVIHVRRMWNPLFGDQFGSTLFRRVTCSPILARATKQWSDCRSTRTTSPRAYNDEFQWL